MLQAGGVLCRRTGGRRAGDRAEVAVVVQLPGCETATLHHRYDRHGQEETGSEYIHIFRCLTDTFFTLYNINTLIIVCSIQFFQFL